jgi:hypothetical protein
MPFYAGGPQMMFNAVAWALEDETLTPLRANVLRARPLDVVSEDRAAVIKWGCTVGAPAVLCLAGLVRRQVLRATRRRQRLSGGAA